MSVVRREPYFLASTPPKPSPSPKGLYFRYSANLFWFSLRTIYEASSVGLKAVRMRLIEELLSPI